MQNRSTPVNAVQNNTAVYKVHCFLLRKKTMKRVPFSSADPMPFSSQKPFSKLSETCFCAVFTYFSADSLIV